MGGGALVVVVGGAGQGAAVPRQGEDRAPLAGGDDAGGTTGGEAVAIEQDVGAAAGRDPRHVLLLGHPGAHAVGPNAGRVDAPLRLDLEAPPRPRLAPGGAD